MAKKGYFWLFLSLFKSPWMQVLHLFQPKRWSLWSVRGVRTKNKNKLANFDVCSPHIPKNQLPRNNSLCRSRSHIPRLLLLSIHRAMTKLFDRSQPFPCRIDRPKSFRGLFLVMFWDFDCNTKQNDARECKSMQISAKIHQNYAILCKNKPPFAYKNIYFA